MLAPKLPDIEMSENARFDASGGREISKMVARVERIIEKEVRSPALEDTSLDEPSLRALNARVHASLI